VLSNILDLGMNPQAALDAPRFCVDRADSTVGAASVAESHVFLEEGVTQEAAEKLRAMGHDVVGWPVEGQGRTVFGRGQVGVGGSQCWVGGSGRRARGEGGGAAVFGEIPVVQLTRSCAPPDCNTLSRCVSQACLIISMKLCLNRERGR
jgi:gamma-glutamyltranspeptidase